MTNTQILNSINKEIKQLTKAFEKGKTNQSNDLKSEWIDNREVMNILRVSERTISRLRNCGALPFTRVHGRILFKKTDVEELLENNYHKINRQSCGCK